MPAAWAAGMGASLSALTVVDSPQRETAPGWEMAGIETAVETARRYIIKRPRLTRLLDNANARVLMLVAPAGFGKTTLAREWVADRPHVWYRGTTATADVAALAAGLADTVAEVLPHAGQRMVQRMRATGTPEEDVRALAEIFAEDLAGWPEDTWLVFDDYHFAMEAEAPERFVDLLLKRSRLPLLLTSRKRPTWATARRLLYGEAYELGRNDLAMDREEAAEVLAHRKDAPASGLVTLAEGWPAVIGLAALTDDFELPEGTLPDALYEYFAEELFQAASPDVQRGLCRLALAPSLGEGVAEFLLGKEAATVMAEGLRLGFLNSSRPGSVELHPMLRAFLDTRTLEWNPEETEVAANLATHFGGRERWDDAFDLVERFFSERLFTDLLETALPSLLHEARLPTLTRWLELAQARRVDEPVVDLVEAELAFRHGRRQKAETFGAKAALRFGASHVLVSRALYIAGMSAHMDFRNESAQTYFAQGREAATTATEQRDAIWGQIMSSVDLDRPDVPQLLADLTALHDGSALSEVRAVLARFLVAIRSGTLPGLHERFEAVKHMVARIQDPLIVSSFHVSYGILLALLGRYEEALAVSSEGERYAKDERLIFALPHAKHVKAMGECGLRRFSKAHQLVDSLERDAAYFADVFLQLESRMLRCRVLLAQNLPARAVDALKDPPEFPFEGERGEYLATMALAYACCGDDSSALPLAQEAEAISRTVEASVLVPCTRAIVALQMRLEDAAERCRDALRTVIHVGNADSFVTAYRGYPALLDEVALHEDLRPALVEIMERARDTTLARKYQIRTTRGRRAANYLSEREREVLGLVAQGLTNREIAQTLFISESTAKVHVRHIFEKLGVRSRTEAALRAAADEQR
jgi:DNA-binding CsgD family transcriptional regulator